jgi:hypothetical protein
MVRKRGIEKKLDIGIPKKYLKIRRVYVERWQYFIL